ncbi:transcriptional regulator, TetR family [Desulfonatronum thiosulfatophilum]|uniref:Transcriptional regulator, TetR family n=1 Tax=Desulfonatronum thiosulfatophilum TaxID=617002 RepID=A0A1G6DPT4_9BACT|nr:TetR/AcrR family transcriptional regulator [Desulfonatronum thiosulfatophilum]SDB47121.1 transcriptional regulator, TetR family [Desulfonatronum thiosulfatophilum]
MSTSTPDRILDAAERLFARDGYHATSMRRLTGEAGVNLGSVNYHFSTKHGLMEAIIQRRLSGLNKQRLGMLKSALAAAEAEDRRPTVLEILRALLEPTLRLLEEDSGNTHFIMLIGRVFYESDDTVRKLFMKAMSPVIGRFFEALCLSLPDIPRPVLLRRLLFTLGAMGSTLSLTGRKADFAFPGASLDWNAEHLLRQLLAFAVAGMEAPCSD